MSTGRKHDKRTCRFCHTHRSTPGFQIIRDGATNKVSAHAIVEGHILTKLETGQRFTSDWK